LLAAPRSPTHPDRPPGDPPEERLVALYRSYGGAIYARCRRILGDDPTAQDATQETFMRVHRHIERAPDQRDVLRWIYRIATNYCLNELRGRRLRPLPVDQLPELPPLDSPDDRIADRQLAQHIVHEMPEKLRAVAWLYHVDGLEQTEVADILGISRRTVVNRLAEFQERGRRIFGQERARG
jgi:RNA polymerase sigma-70 factor (ECF subfamily)